MKQDENRQPADWPIKLKRPDFHMSGPVVFSRQQPAKR
jgi:hypothetical protein